MRSAISKNLVLHFTRQLERKLPMFHQMVVPKGTPPIWVYNVAPVLTFFILLQSFREHDKFALELAWSEDGEFPWDLNNVFQSNERESKGRERFPRWETDKEHVWDLDPEATAAAKVELEALSRGEYVPYSEKNVPVDQVLANIESIVEDAIQKFIRRGLPFFRQVADRRGIVLQEGLSNCHE